VGLAKKVAITFMSRTSNSLSTPLSGKEICAERAGITTRAYNNHKRTTGGLIRKRSRLAFRLVIGSLGRPLG